MTYALSEINDSIVSESTATEDFFFYPFSDQHIDKASFHDLTEEDIKELIPILGIRKKFLSKYGAYINQVICQEIVNFENNLRGLF